MLTCEGYKMFYGEATVTPLNPKFPPMTIKGTWLYRPDTDCWYVNGRSFPDEIVEGFAEDAE